MAHQHGLDCIQPGTGDIICGINDPRYTTRHRLAKWNVDPSVLMAKDAGLTRSVFPGLTKAQHEQLARKYAREAEAAEAKYQKAVSAATKAMKGRDLGPLISGIVSERFPEKTKDKLRKLAHAPGKLRDASVAHWKASGKRTDWYFALGAGSKRG